jgi:hypothetical protein
MTMKKEPRFQHVFGRANASTRRCVLVLVSLLGATACGAENSTEEEIASIELEDGNIVSFERFGDGIAITEVGLAANGSHLTGRARRPSDLFRELAPGRALPQALLEHQRANVWENLRPGTLVFPSREAFEKFDMSTLDRSRVATDGPTWMGDGPAPSRAGVSAEVPPAPPQTGAFQQNAGVCGSFIASQCNLNNAGMNGSPPDNIIVAPNITLRIDDADAIRGHHTMCAADGNGTLRVFVPEHPNFGTGTNERFIPEGSFTTTVWEHPLECIEFGDPGPLGDGDDETICFLETTFVSVDARTEVFDVGSFHYCRAYDSNPN